MTLERIRALAQQKKELFFSSPEYDENDRNHIELINTFFSNVEYIENASKGLVESYLYTLGMSINECRETYEKLMEEINKTYKVFAPEALRDEDGVTPNK